MDDDVRTGRDRPGGTVMDRPLRVVGPDYSGPGVEAETAPDRSRSAPGPGRARGGEGREGREGREGSDGYVTLYTARASSGGGRAGRVASDDGLLDLEMRAPRQLGGPGGAPNPEQLMAAAYAACFHSSLELVAGRSGADTADACVEAAVELRKRGKSDDYAIGVEVTVRMPKVDRDTAERLAGQAHRHCPYSKALLGGAEVEVRVA
ncbi:Ohr family peroxiredoxin [Planomonospora corallina]|uniref:Ohr family peroxiredoxin n=1 Tax=Planomonospora corallina TaxID=1806052 RepID=A0ABV8ICN8_9ACTN